MFEGVVGAGDLGDIAIDDITLQNGSCSHAGKTFFCKGEHVHFIFVRGERYNFEVGHYSTISLQLTMTLSMALEHGLIQVWVITLTG